MFLEVLDYNCENEKFDNKVAINTRYITNFYVGDKYNGITATIISLSDRSLVLASPEYYDVLKKKLNIETAII